MTKTLLIWTLASTQILNSNHMGQGLGNTRGEAKQLLFALQKRRNYYGCTCVSGGIVMKKTDMFKTSGRASFLVILFQFLQYCVFVHVVLSGDAVALFSPVLLLQFLLHIRKNAYKTFFALKDRFAITGIGRLLCLVAQILLLTFLKKGPEFYHL